MIDEDGYVDTIEVSDCIMDFAANLYYNYHPDDNVAMAALCRMIENTPLGEDGTLRNKA